LLYTPTHQQALARKVNNRFLLIGLGGSLHTSREAANELKNSSHLILELSEALEVAMS